MIYWTMFLILILNVKKAINYIFYVQIKIAIKLELCGITKNVNVLNNIKNVRFKFINFQSNNFKVKYLRFNHFKK
jgi:hypothetical protein